MRVLETDVLVIGAGGGGAMAAYHAAKHGARVAVVSKSAPGRGGSTIMAPGAIAAVGDWAAPGDSADQHFDDTIRGGAFMGEQRLVRLVVDETPDLVLELERIGALWQREADGSTYSLRIDGGHTWPRCPFLEDRTGREMLRALLGELIRRGVPLVSDVMILELIRDSGGGLAGAAGVDLRRGEPFVARASAVVLACGGGGQVYSNTSCPTGVTGDAYSLALGAGATLMDMEFVQFFPLGFTHPPSLRGCLGGLLFHVHLLNSEGERFLERYEPERLELSTRDAVARAMVSEVEAGRGGPHGGVFADMRFQPPGFIERMQPALYHTYRKIGFDPAVDLLEVSPTCHFMMGGVKVDEDWQSSVPGLFVVGEGAAGVHGANRLSQNALSDLLVSGARAGRAAAARARAERPSPLDPNLARGAADQALACRGRPGCVSPRRLRQRLGEVLWRGVGVRRTESGLRAAQDEIAALRECLDQQEVRLSRSRENRQWVEALENRFLLDTAACIVSAALERRESRGSHWRDDHPAQDNDAWLRHILVGSDEAGDTRLSFAPVDLSVVGRPEATPPAESLE